MEMWYVSREGVVFNSYPIDLGKDDELELSDSGINDQMNAGSSMQREVSEKEQGEILGQEPRQKGKWCDMVEEEVEFEFLKNFKKSELRSSLRLVDEALEFELGLADLDGLSTEEVDEEGVRSRAVTDGEA